MGIKQILEAIDAKRKYIADIELEEDEEPEELEKEKTSTKIH